MFTQVEFTIGTWIVPKLDQGRITKFLVKVSSSILNHPKHSKAATFTASQHIAFFTFVATTAAEAIARPPGISEEPPSVSNAVIYRRAGRRRRRTRARSFK